MGWFLPKVIQWRRSFCLLACLLLGIGVRPLMWIYLHRTLRHHPMLDIVYICPVGTYYNTLTPAWADLYICELENRPQKDMHITIRRARRMQTHLKLTMQASKWAPMGVKLIDFRRIKWGGWCGKPFRTNSCNNKKIEKLSLVWPPQLFLSPAPCKSM